MLWKRLAGRLRLFWSIVQLKPETETSGRNLSEVHALNTLVNSSPRILLNEDIHHRSWIALEPCWRSAHQLVWPITRWGVMTTQTPKSRDKERSLEDLSHHARHGLPGTKTDRGREPCRRAGGKRPELQSIRAGAMMGTTLRRMGYFLTEMVLNGLDFGAYRGEKRYYMVASVFLGSFHRNLSRELVDDCGR